MGIGDETVILAVATLLEVAARSGWERGDKDTAGETCGETCGEEADGEKCAGEEGFGDGDMFGEGGGEEKTEAETPTLWKKFSILTFSSWLINSHLFGLSNNSLNKYSKCPPSPVHEAEDVHEVGVVRVWQDDGVEVDILAEEGGEDVEDVPVDILLLPLGPDGAADEGEVGHMVGPPVVAQVLVDITEVGGRWHGKHTGLTESKPTPRA